MDSIQNPTAANCSQPPPQQPKIQMDSTQNPTAATVHKLPSSPTGPAEFSTKHRARKLFTTFPASQGTPEFSTKTYLYKLFTTPTFSQSPAGSSSTPCPAKQYATDSNKTLSSSCFQPPQKPKVKTEQHLHPAVPAVKVLRSSLNEQCLDFSEANSGKQCTSNSLTFLPLMPLFLKQRFLKKY